MIFSAFSDYPELSNKGLTIIYGVAVVTVYGRLLLLLSTLTQPKKKAVQTPYSQFALLGGGILSIIGLIVSFTVFSGGAASHLCVFKRSYTCFPLSDIPYLGRKMSYGRELRGA